MLVLKASYYKWLSVASCSLGDYERSLHYAKKSAKAYIKSKKVFNSRNLEACIGKCADALVAHDTPHHVNNDRIGILASTIFDVGGHTECLMRFAESFHKEYSLFTFFTNSHGDSKVEAKTKYAYLETIVTVETVMASSDYSAKLKQLIYSIIKSEVKMIFVYMHMDDVVACAALSYIAKNTDIKIIFINHGDHTFSLGFESSSIIIDMRKQGQYITQRYRKKMNSTIIPLQGVSREKIKIYPDDELLNKRLEIGLKPDAPVSLSGFASYKVFKDRGNAYLKFVKRLLKDEPNLQHVLVTEVSEKEKNKITKVFRGEESLLERLKIVSRVAEFDLLLQASDVFIDSFPLGSALVHIDAIRNKRPTVIKKNSNNELYTFYNYLYDNYEYAIEDMNEILSKTLFLLRNKTEQHRIAEKCYAHYLNTYEFETIKARYKQLIENHQSLERFYTPLPREYKCSLAV